MFSLYVFVCVLCVVCVFVCNAFAVVCVCVVCFYVCVVFVSLLLYRCLLSCL